MLQPAIVASGDFWSGLTDLLRSITPYGVMGIFVFLIRVDRRLTVMRVILTGEKGDNGIKGEVKSLRSRMHNAENEIHGLKGEDALLRQRLDSAGL